MGISNDVVVVGDDDDVDDLVMVDVDVYEDDDVDDEVVVDVDVVDKFLMRRGHLSRHFPALSHLTYSNISA